MNKRKKRSIIWKIPTQKLREIVQSSETIGQILSHFSLSNKGGNYKTLYSRLNEEKINFEHIPLGIDSNKGRKFFSKNKKSIEEILVEDSSYNRSWLKKRLIREKIIEEICKECGLSDSWNNKKLVLVLDHINGISNDNRLENLRFLCPNCNSQTDTFCGKRKKYEIKKQKYSKDFGISELKVKEKLICRCGKEKRFEAKYCSRKCYFEFGVIKLRPHLRKVKRPSKEILLKQLETSNYSALGRKYGVSDNAIRKWLK